MKGAKRRFLRKLKVVSVTSTLKQGLIVQLNSSERYSNQSLQNPPTCKGRKQNSNLHPKLNLGNTNLAKPGNDLEDETKSSFSLFKTGSDRFSVRSKFSAAMLSKDTSSETSMLLEVGSQKFPTVPLPEADTFRRSKNNEEPIRTHEAKNTEESPSLLEFEAKCPPGGSESVILYTTSLRGIRNTFEDCNSIRFLLESFRVLFHERDVSMHLEFREELWRIMGCRVVPPRLFIKGRLIGGADEVVGLHEQGKLLKLLEGVPLAPSNRLCDGCGGTRFVVCFTCNGSCKVFTDGVSVLVSIRCPQCNENGLVRCPICY